MQFKRGNKVNENIKIKDLSIENSQNKNISCNDRKKLNLNDIATGKPINFLLYEGWSKGIVTRSIDLDLGHFVWKIWENIIICTIIILIWMDKILFSEHYTGYTWTISLTVV